MEYEDTISGILENKLKAYDFYNFAVGSYSPTVHLFNLEKQIQMGNVPSKIILLLDMTDINDEAARWIIKDGIPVLQNTYHYDNFHQKEKFFHKNFRVTRSFFHFINYQTRMLRSQHRSHLDYVKTSLQAGFTYREIDELGDHYKNGIFKYGLEKIKEKIISISNISKKINSEFYLIIYPYAETLIFGQEKYNWEKYASEICNLNYCKLINTFDIFRNYKLNNKNWYKDLYFIGDEHFNSRGNSIIAYEILNKIF